MYLLDYERRLHQSKSDSVEYTVERFDETATYRYTALIAVDDLLFVRELIDGDETDTTYAVFLNKADEVSNIWTYREFQTYTRFDLTRNSTPVLVAPFVYYQPFDLPDGSGDTGGTTSPAPNAVGQTGCQIINDTLSGVTVSTAAGFITNFTLTTPLSGGCRTEVGVNHDFLDQFALHRLVFYGSLGAIAKVQMILIGGIYSVQVISTDATVATVYSSATKPTLPCNWDIDINLIAKTLTILCSADEFTNNIDIDISGGLTATDFSYLTFEPFRATVGDDTTGMYIEELKIYQRT